ncbi:MAG: SET domain-containing protein [Bradyrhizobiaceae bacterium]|nr:SET domain-containing protein [Bradyrhizobiaceae bacterium]
MSKASRGRPYRVGRSRTGLGLFATQFISKGRFIVRYTGPRITNDEADKRDNRYLFELNNRWTIDGTTRKNIARYINHSCRPNAEVYFVGHAIKIRARRNIQPGEEIGYDYGRDYFDSFIKPKGCKCVKCMEKRREERRAKRQARRRAKSRRKGTRKRR